MGAAAQATEPDAGPDTGRDRAAVPQRLASYPGAAKPGFTLPRLDGDRVALSQFADRVVVVHFFATWCVPCRTELPALARLRARFPEHMLVVLLVDVAEAEARVRRFFDAVPAPGPILLDRDRAVARAWEVSLLPATFVLKGDLRPHLWAEGEVDWDAAATDAALGALIRQPPSR